MPVNGEYKIPTELAGTLAIQPGIINTNANNDKSCIALIFQIIAGTETFSPYFSTVTFSGASHILFKNGEPIELYYVE